MRDLLQSQNAVNTQLRSCVHCNAGSCAQPLLMHLQPVTDAASSNSNLKAAARCVIFLQDKGAWHAGAPRSTLRQSCKCWRAAGGRAQTPCCAPLSCTQWTRSPSCMWPGAAEQVGCWHALPRRTCRVLTAIKAPPACQRGLCRGQRRKQLHRIVDCVQLWPAGPCSPPRLPLALHAYPAASLTGHIAALDMRCCTLWLLCPPAGCREPLAPARCRRTVHDLQQQWHTPYADYFMAEWILQHTPAVSFWAGVQYPLPHTGVPAGTICQTCSATGRCLTPNTSQLGDSCQTYGSTVCLGSC